MKEYTNRGGFLITHAKLNYIVWTGAPQRLLPESANFILCIWTCVCVMWLFFLQFINCVICWCLSNLITSCIWLSLLSGAKSQNTALEVASNQQMYCPARLARQTECTARYHISLLLLISADKKCGEERAHVPVYCSWKDNTCFDMRGRQALCNHLALHPWLEF